MEDDLLETFEAAKKAADAAADGAGKSEVDRCLGALRRLKKIPVTTKVLVDTKVGKLLRPLSKHSDEKIRMIAADLLQFWKDKVIEETSRNSKKVNTPQEKSSVKVELKSEQGEKTKGERMSKAVNEESNWAVISQSVSMGKVEYSQGVKIEASKSESVKLNNGANARGGESATPQRTSKDEKQANSRNLPSLANGPPKLTSVVKCSNPARDKLREILAEVFSRVSMETSESTRDEVRNIWDEVDACDPFRVAVIVESALFEKLGPSTGSQKVKYRSILFNLKDSNNPDFRRRVLLGHVNPEDIVDMIPEDMASDERKLSNKQIKEKALFECERGGAPKATTDQFKCGRCGQRKCTYYQMQTRSADEPMTTYVTCVNCNNHWKFC